MYKFDAQRYGIEPNVTGIEEEFNLAYLDGEREATYEIAKNLIELRVDDDIIVKGTGLDLEDIRELKEEFFYAEGQRKAKFEVAKNLIDSGCSNGFIVKITGLDLEDLIKLKKI